MDGVGGNPDRAAEAAEAESGMGNRRNVVAAAVMVAAFITTIVVLLIPGNNAARPSIVRAASTTDDLYARGPGATTLAGTGVPGFNGDGRSAVDSELDAPAGIVEDGSGDLFIADSGNCRVREVPARTGTSFGRPVHAGVIVTLAGGSCSGKGASPPPSALALDATGDLFIAYGPGARVEELPAKSTAAFGVPMAAGKLALVAGTGSSGYGGDGGPASRSRLDDPTGLAVDADGDLLISDTGNCRLRLVAASGGSRFGVTMVLGRIYTVAGSGICGSAGDGGPALQAQLWDPGALAVDTAGDVLIADQGNRTIRELAGHAGTFFGVPLAADHLGTIVGEGSYGPYLIDGISALGETAEINFPTAIALDAEGNLYIADGDMHAIRFVPSSITTLLGVTAKPDDMYTAAGAMSTTVLHNKTTWIQTHLLDPSGLVLSSGGRLIYSDAQADVVRELPVDR
jgi:hypothetical protein